MTQTLLDWTKLTQTKPADGIKLIRTKMIQFEVTRKKPIEIKLILTKLIWIKMTNRIKLAWTKPIWIKPT